MDFPNWMAQLTIQVTTSEACHNLLGLSCPLEACRNILLSCFCNLESRPDILYHEIVLCSFLLLVVAT